MFLQDDVGNLSHHVCLVPTETVILDFQIVALAAAHYGDGTFEMAGPREGTCAKVLGGLEG